MFLREAEGTEAFVGDELGPPEHLLAVLGSRPLEIALELRSAEELAHPVARLSMVGFQKILNLGRDGKGVVFHSNGVLKSRRGGSGS